MEVLRRRFPASAGVGPASIPSPSDRSDESDETVAPVAFVSRVCRDWLNRLDESPGSGSHSRQAATLRGPSTPRHGELDAPLFHDSSTTL